MRKTPREAPRSIGTSRRGAASRFATLSAVAAAPRSASLSTQAWLSAPLSVVSSVWLPTVTETWPLEEAEQVHARVEEGKTIGRAALLVAPEYKSKATRAPH